MNATEIKWNKEELTERFIGSLASHPYFWAAIICLALNPFFFGATKYITGNALTLGSYLVFAVAALFGAKQYFCSIVSKKRFVIFLCYVLIAILYLATLYGHSENKAAWHAVGGCVAMMLGFSLLFDIRKYSGQLISLMIMGMGFWLKFYYILITAINVRQHDVFTAEEGSGHIGYIQYFTFYHRLSDFDVRERWQFYHPPLHHAICAAWVELNEKVFQVGHYQSWESLQTLTLFYSTCIVIIAYKIFRHFELKGWSLYGPLMIVSMHPTFVLFSGSINNDVLSVALVMGATLWTLKWIKEPTTKNILKIAVCIGLAMMTKLTAAMVAPPVALVFFVKLIKERKTLGKTLIKQYFSFGAICIPLGLWFPIRSYLKWDIPLTYVAPMKSTFLQYIGDIPFLKRVTDFSTYQFASPYEQWKVMSQSGQISGYNEFNPLIALLKNSLFGEYINQDSFQANYVNLAARILFWLNVVLVIAAFVGMIVTCTRRRNLEKVFLVSFYIIQPLFLYKAAADYPFTCTMNSRYVAPMIVLGTVFLGVWMNEGKRDCGLKTMIVRFLRVGGVLFAFLSGLIFLHLS